MSFGRLAITHQHTSTYQEMSVMWNRNHPSHKIYHIHTFQQYTTYLLFKFFFTYYIYSYNLICSYYIYFLLESNYNLLLYCLLQSNYSLLHLLQFLESNYSLLHLLQFLQPNYSLLHLLFY